MDRSKVLGDSQHQTIPLQLWTSIAKQQTSATDQFARYISPLDVETKKNIHAAWSILHARTLLHTLEKLAIQTNQLSQDTYGNYAFKTTVKIFNTPATNEPIVGLFNLASQMPSWLQQIFIPLAQISWQDMLQRSTQHIDSVWQLTLFKFYEEHLAQRYPFEESALDDVTLQDFSQFFKPGGIVDLFYRTYLEPFYISDSQTTMLKDRFGVKLPITPSVMKNITVLQQIQTMFFSQGAFITSFSLMPDPSQPSDIKSITLNMNGHFYDIDPHKNQVWLFHWPIRGEQTVGLIAKNTAGQPSMASRHGHWALFRLINTAQIQKSPDPMRILLSFPIQNLAVRFSLTPESNLNPFKPHLFSTINLPGHLIN